MTPRLVHFLLVLDEGEQVAAAITAEDLDLEDDDVLDLAMRIGRARQEIEDVERDVIATMKARKNEADDD